MVRVVALACFALCSGAYSEAAYLVAACKYPPRPSKAKRGAVCAAKYYLSDFLIIFKNWLEIVGSEQIAKGKKA